MAEIKLKNVSEGITANGRYYSVADLMKAPVEITTASEGLTADGRYWTIDELKGNTISVEGGEPGPGPEPTFKYTVRGTAEPNAEIKVRWNSQSDGTSVEAEGGELVVTTADGDGNWEAKFDTDPTALTYLLFTFNGEDGGENARIRSVELPEGVDYSQITSWARAFSFTGLDRVSLYSEGELIDFSNVTNMRDFASYTPNLTAIDGLSSLNLGEVTNFRSAFASTAMDTIELKNLYTPFDCNSMFQSAMATRISMEPNNYVDAVTPRDCYRMFYNCPNLSDLNLNLYPEDITDCGQMFRNCASLTSVPQFWTEDGEIRFLRCTNAKNMFSGSGLENADLEGWYFNGAALDNLFSQCRSLETAILPNMTNCTANAILNGCNSLQEVRFGQMRSTDISFDFPLAKLTTPSLENLLDRLTENAGEGHTVTLASQDINRINQIQSLNDKARTAIEENGWNIPGVSLSE